jgi:hypothetical protein
MTATTAIGIWDSDGQEIAQPAPPCDPSGEDPYGRVLARYTDARHGARELVVTDAHAGSRLVIDRGGDSGEDARLIAHLAPDEPEVNARIVCSEYLCDPSPTYCRRLHETDVVALPAWALPELGSGFEAAEVSSTAPFALARVPIPGREIAELRWTSQPAAPGHAPSVLSLRRVVGELESYEPARTLSLTAVARHRSDSGLSVATLAAELDRLAASPIVLNRLLRRAVQRAVADGVSMSLIAMRCGRVKRDARGNVSGETSWLGRRLGILPEGGATQPTPWIHSDVLAVIARRGLGTSPREVELG